MVQFFQQINVIQVYICCTLLFSLSLVKTNRFEHKLLMLVLGISFLNEFLSTYLIKNHYENSYHFITNVYLIVTISLWLYALLKLAVKKNRTYKYMTLWLFVMFALMNSIFVEGFMAFNYLTPVVGVLVYIALFFGISFEKLRKEQFIFFYNNQYILLAAPVFFLLGLGVVFSFQNPSIPKVEVLFSLTLYQLINYITNIICYSLINIYIIKERKELAHAY